MRATSISTGDRDGDRFSPWTVGTYPGEVGQRNELVAGGTVSKALLLGPETWEAYEEGADAVVEPVLGYA